MLQKNKNTISEQLNTIILLYHNKLLQQSIIQKLTTQKQTI